MVGRPRSFDREEALEKAVEAFWERGYDGTSISDLTTTIGIAAPSLYAAFGDKERLFEEASGRSIERYEAALQRVRPEDRELIVLRIEMGMSYEELAAAVGKPSANAARMSVLRALLRLGEEIERGG
jgi:AcrR family transcriptional regulator